MLSTAQIRIGVFDVDLRAGELRRKGLQVKLQEQPFQVLAMLLEHAGNVVTREELQTKLWPVDTIVDFDHGLNKAINKVRNALGDSAENPRFVETVGRRGYRFIAEPAVVGETPLDRSEPAIEDSPATIEPDRVDFEERAAGRKRLPWRLGGSTSMFALVRSSNSSIPVSPLRRLDAIASHDVGCVRLWS